MSSRLHRLAGEKIRPAPVDAAESVWLAPEHDIFGDGEIRAQVDFLVHAADAQLLRMLGRAHVYGSPIQLYRTAVRMFDAGQDFDQRGLARPVLAHQRVHFARPQREVDVLQGDDAWKGFGDAFHGEQIRSEQPRQCSVVSSRISESI